MRNDTLIIHSFSFNPPYQQGQLIVGLSQAD